MSFAVRKGPLALIPRSIATAATMGTGGGQSSLRDVASAANVRTASVRPMRLNDPIQLTKCRDHDMELGVE